MWEGGEVRPRQFQQFLVTAGPLPADGRIVFGAVQGYADGTVEQWTEPSPGPGVPGAPAITLVPQPVDAEPGARPRPGRSAAAPRRARRPARRVSPRPPTRPCGSCWPPSWWCWSPVRRSPTGS
ncbi:hypothetical protein BJF78_32025 [Pseudonocardia sp. CNS-139]|nr:hypothetical protein BJF78_32025 [Pseudonocardia sp. CNS-139]